MMSQRKRLNELLSRSADLDTRPDIAFVCAIGTAPHFENCHDFVNNSLLQAA